MATANLSRPEVSGNPATPATPARRRAPTPEALVEQWLKVDRSNLSARLKLGAAVQSLLASSLRGCQSAAERRSCRARTVEDLRRRLSSAGITGESARVDDFCRCFAVFSVLRAEVRDCPAWRTLRALAPLVRRDQRTERWRIRRPELLAHAQALYAEACVQHSTADEVRSLVAELIGKKPKAKPQAWRAAAKKLQASLASIDDAAALSVLASQIQARITALSAALRLSA